jgi:DNA-binding MarR family transcriptional regulator
MPAQLSRGSRKPPAQEGPITTVITLFRRVAQLMVDDLASRLEDSGFPGVTPAIHPVFENVDPAGTRLTELASRTGMTHQSMGELVTALEKRGYVERRPDPADGRARLVCLTSEGRRLARRAVREIDAIAQEWQRHFAAAGLTADLREVLEAAMDRAQRSPRQKEAISGHANAL